MMREQAGKHDQESKRPGSTNRAETISPADQPQSLAEHDIPQRGITFLGEDVSKQVTLTSIILHISIDRAKRP
jgi:hypothetical protein